MARPVTIARLSRLKNIYVFQDFTAAPDLPAVRRYNLVYGFNGCGKTTLSRIFASLGVGTLRSELPSDCEFRFELTDGTSIAYPGSLGQLAGRIFVFNGDFIEDNFQWRDGRAKPVFYLGKEQKELAAQLQQAEEEQRKLTSHVVEAERIAREAAKMFATNRRDGARLIAEALGLGRRYDATTLDADYAAAVYDKSDEQNDRDLQDLRLVINQPAPAPKIPSIDETDLSVSGLVQRAFRNLKQTIGIIAIRELGDHAAMVPWLKQGHAYHCEHGLHTCLFCGNTLTPDRLQELETMLDAKFDAFTREIDDTEREATELRERLVTARDRLPSKSEFAPAAVDSASKVISGMRTDISHIEGVVRDILGALAQKRTSLNIAIENVLNTSQAAAAGFDQDLLDKWAELRSLIVSHNEAHDAFPVHQEAARTKLKRHFLAVAQTEYRQLEKAAGDATKIRDGLQAKNDRAREKIQNIHRQMRKHGPAADLMNRLIRNYLGHRELQIATLEDGYQLVRNGKPARGQPSEGEKTAIVLCYFLVLLDGEGRNRRDLIVVLDDPISSLDTRALNYASSVIQSSFQNVGQLFVLTHNLQLMNEGKKWLKSTTERAMVDRDKPKDDATSALFFIDTVQPGGKDTRASTIVEMPKHIREYESEYQYLFHLTLRFLASKDDQLNYFFIVPNALRKLLDVFLAFKEPGSMGLLPKLKNVVDREKPKLDEIRLQALERLVQLESHADNIEDLIAFSSMTVEETKDAATTLISFIQIVDPVHHDRMVRLCKP